MKKSGQLLVVTCALVLGSGCLERKGAPVGPNVGFGQEVEIGGPDVSRVDVLFVIDNSFSMQREQDNLAEQIPALVRDLAMPPDRNGDGDPDWNAAEELRIGIVTTDVGMGSTTIEGSRCVPGGDDGALRGGVYEWRAGDDPDTFAARVGSTVEELGVRGCAFEQPLEAAARAVARAEETGFPRADGLFAVIVVTDEEDCSVDDDDAFFGPMQPLEYNVYCGRNQAQLTPVPELLERIRGDRDEEDFIFAAIAGVPVGTPPNADPASLLAREDMQFREDGARAPQPVAVCGSDSPDDFGEADPARRLVELSGLVSASVLTTICADDFGPAISLIGERIGASIPGVCLIRALPSGVVGRVPCDVSVTLPVGATCAGRPGYRPLGVEGDREVCELEQVAGPASGSGFYYDPDNAVCAQLVITADALPPVGASLAAECFFPLLFGDGDQCARSSQCESGWCDPITNACDTLRLPDTSSPSGPTG